MQANAWINGIDSARNMDELKSSSSILRQMIPDFEVDRGMGSRTGGGGPRASRTCERAHTQSGDGAAGRESRSNVLLWWRLVGVVRNLQWYGRTRQSNRQGWWKTVNIKAVGSRVW